jgi:hypothetical protein
LGAASRSTRSNPRADELNPAAYGDLRLIDSFRLARREVTLANIAYAYKQTVQFRQRLREYCRRAGSPFHGRV